ncbi:MAG: hypothetical protein KJ626_09955 [Verrucomicrobia bacterium]|nr:hypothetical protein [Verrucomicrobiota bacterium]
MRLPACIILAILAASALYAANVDLTLYNTYALLDSDDSTPLEGTSSAGDLIQLIHAGANETIDPPAGDLSPGGDDTLLSAASNPTHVDAGRSTTNSGKFSQSGMLFDDSLVGDKVYIRFWNASTTAGSTYYGESAVTNLPAADGFGFAELDVVPSSSSPRTTSTANSATALEVPTLTEWGFIALGAILVGWGCFSAVSRQFEAVPAVSRER